jgi:autotransporter family porin
LIDCTGAPITSTYQQGVSNPGSTTPSAIGTFSYGLSTGSRLDGLYVNYCLNSLKLVATGAGALLLQGAKANNGTPSNDLAASVDGSGDLAIDSPNDGTVVTLSSTANDYTGQTVVRSGILQLQADRALGNTSNLVISAPAAVDLNAHTQTVGALNTAAGSSLSLAEGNLTIANGGVSGGVLSGELCCCSRLRRGLRTSWANLLLREALRPRPCRRIRACTNDST